MKYLIATLLFSFSLFCAEYEISGKKMEFLYKNKKLVSKNCKKDCLALHKKISKKVFESFDRNLGRNPSTAACKYLEGEIVMAKSQLGHKTYFCKFKDKSYIHSGHLR